MKYIFFLLLTIISNSCNSQNKNQTNVSVETSNPKPENKSSQIGEYIIEIFEDSKGNLWFGTIEKGVAKYDGKKLKYITSNDGLPSNFVAEIIEDKNGDLWFGTSLGLSKYDGKSFTNFTIEDGLCHNRISNLFIDSKGILWIGTWGGVCTYDGHEFSNFPIPYPSIETLINKDTKDWITDINEDSKRNMWFGRDGYGASKFNGQSFTHFTTKQGLYSNNIQQIQEDKQGNFWFGSRVAERDNSDPKKRFGKGGINKYNGKTFISFPDIVGLNNNDVYSIYQDNSDNLWISTKNNGVYEFDGKEFKNYSVPISIMNITEDRNGNLWLGGAGGLYLINSKGITNVTTNGPWK